MTMLKVIVLIGFFSLSKSQNGFFPNLPLGESQVVYHRVYPCEPTKNHSLKFNLYFSKNTSSITELKGNLTLLVPFDDSFTLDVNFASWGLTGGWKPNSIVFISKNACNQLKKILGNIWFKVMKAFKLPADNCPLPVGTYVTSGINLKELEEHNFPKIYFYGKYKALFKIKNEENKVIGCGTVEMSLLRPWEKPV